MAWDYKETLKLNGIDMPNMTNDQMTCDAGYESKEIDRIMSNARKEVKEYVNKLEKAKSYDEYKSIRKPEYASSALTAYKYKVMRDLEKAEKEAGDLAGEINKAGSAAYAKFSSQKSGGSLFRR